MKINIEMLLVALLLVLVLVSGIQAYQIASLKTGGSLISQGTSSSSSSSPTSGTTSGQQQAPTQMVGGC